MKKVKTWWLGSRKKGLPPQTPEYPRSKTHTSVPQVAPFVSGKAK